MKEETSDFLDFIKKDLNPPFIHLDSYNYYLRKLPYIYNNDITFRLLFDWHFKLDNRHGSAWYRPSGTHLKDELFEQQVALINGWGKNMYNSSYQYRELILFHARVDLQNKCLLEIGGSTHNDLIFETLRVHQYINIESPDYIDASGNSTYSEKHLSHPNRKTIFTNAEKINSFLESKSIDHIFSVACFEHIYDLEAALIGSYNCLKERGTLYSYFAPIYSYLEDGDHGVIPEHKLFANKPIGLHLLSNIDQRKELVDAGICNPTEIQDVLGRINFDRIPNRLKYEEYEKILTESPFRVIDLERLDNLNLSKKYPKVFDQVRRSNKNVGNMMTGGFRVFLIKE